MSVCNRPHFSYMRLLVLGGAFIVSTVFLSGCATLSSTAATTSPTPTTDVEATVSSPIAVITTNGGGTVTVVLELAITPEQQARGLMFREHLEPNAGMLFIFGYDAPHGFWMRNTLIPLDVLYISYDGAVVHIRQQAQPQDETIYIPPAPCRYVLEVNGGFCDREGVADGSQVTFVGL